MRYALHACAREAPSSSHAFSIAGRPASPASKQDRQVGPGLYYNPDAEAALQGSTAFTIGARLTLGDRVRGADSPGPASYSAPVNMPGPSYTIGARHEAAGEWRGWALAACTVTLYMCAWMCGQCSALRCTQCNFAHHLCIWAGQCY